MTIEEFFNKWNNQSADFDGWYGAQCVDLIQYYNKDVYGGPFIGGQAAADMWETYPIDFYERVLNTPEAIPIFGDVMIWKKTTTLPYGHISIFKEGDINKFTSLDQNWPTNSIVHLQQHDYNGIIGWLHPIKTPVGTIIINEWQKQLQAYNGVFYKPEDVIKFIEERKTEINTLNSAITTKDETITNLNKQISDLEKAKNTLADELKQCQIIVKDHTDCQNKIITATQLQNQAEQDLAKERGAWELQKVDYNNQINDLKKRYNSINAPLKKLLIDWIFGKKI